MFRSIRKKKQLNWLVNVEQLTKVAQIFSSYMHVTFAHTFFCSAVTAYNFLTLKDEAAWATFNSYVRSELYWGVGLCNVRSSLKSRSDFISQPWRKKSKVVRLVGPRFEAMSESTC